MYYIDYNNYNVRVYITGIRGNDYNYCSLIYNVLQCITMYHNTMYMYYNVLYYNVLQCIHY